MIDYVYVPYGGFSIAIRRKSKFEYDAPYGGWIYFKFIDSCGRISEVETM